MTNTTKPTGSYQSRLRGYEADKRRIIPTCKTNAEVAQLLYDLRKKWRI